MSDRSRNHHRVTRRALDRATRRAIRRGNTDAAWLAAIAVGMTGTRY
jgi:hypothetical protein